MLFVSFLINEKIPIRNRSIVQSFNCVLHNINYVKHNQTFLFRKQCSLTNWPFIKQVKIMD